MAQTKQSPTKRGTRVATGATIPYRGLRISLLCTGLRRVTVHEPQQGAQLALKSRLSATHDWRAIGRELADEQIACYEQCERHGWPLHAAGERALACVRAAEGDEKGSTEEEGGGNEEPNKPPPSEDDYVPASSFTRDLLASVPAKRMTQAEAYAAADDAGKLAMLTDEAARYTPGSDPADDAALCAIGSEMSRINERMGRESRMEREVTA